MMRRTFSIALLLVFLLGTLLPSYALPLMKCCAVYAQVVQTSQAAPQSHCHEMGDQPMSDSHDMAEMGAAQASHATPTSASEISALHVHGCPMPCCAQS